jgi:hypothetical protein
MLEVELPWQFDANLAVMPCPLTELPPLLLKVNPSIPV